jgi:hypothetical protein
MGVKRTHQCTAVEPLRRLKAYTDLLRRQQEEEHWK